MAAASLELTRNLRKRDPEAYHRLVRRLFCKEAGLEEESCFSWEAEGKERKDSAGCLTGIMTVSARVDTEQQQQQPGRITEEALGGVYQVIEWLGLGVNLVEEGIFRKSGSLKKQQELMERLQTGEELRLEERQYSVHECASVLKTFLSNLPEPLVTNCCYQAHLAVAAQPEEDSGRRVLCTQLLLQLIPSQYYKLLCDLLFLLHGVSQRQQENKMSATNLGMMFSTHILCPKSLSAEALQAQLPILTSVTTFLITQPNILFSVPDTLRVEVQTFLSRRSSEGRMNLAKRSEQGLPGVECLIANTVFSFIERDPDPDKQE